MPRIAANLIVLAVTQAVLVSCHYSHHWPNGYNRYSRSHTWSSSPYNSGQSFQRQTSANSVPSQTGVNSFPRFSAAQQSTPQFSRQEAQPFSSSALPKSRSFSSPRNSVYSNKPYLKRLSIKGDRFPSYAERCGNCRGQPRAEVCGSDGKTYKNSCELKYISCKKYWDLREVNKGACASDCPGVNLGMYTGWGLSRASNKGYCHHDFFRCCKAALKTGLPKAQVRSCCQARADKCFAFIEEKPWRSGITKYGK